MLIRYLWLAGLLIAGIAAAQDLVANAGFEEVAEGRPVGWSIVGPAEAVTSQPGGHAGERCVRISDPDAKTGINLESARVPCRPGGQYTASAWFRTADKCSPGVYLNFHDDVGNRVHNLFARAAGPLPEWTQATVQTSAPAEALEVSVTIYAYIGDVGAFEVDDVIMTVNGGAEPGSGGIPVAQAGTKEVVEIGSRLELFVDSFMLDGVSGTAQRMLHHPQPRQPVLVFDKPWEGPTSAYFTVMPVDGKVRIYYRGSSSTETACVVEADDGITFTRPNIGTFEWEGSKENNIVWMGAGCHNFTPFLDGNPDAPADQRFKALASAGPKAELVAFVSADGLHWRKLREEPVITEGAFDSQNLAFWDPVRKAYVEYHRGFRDGFRDIMTATTTDFVNWPAPEWLAYGEAPKEHLYTNAITPYFRAPHIYLGFPNRLVPGRKKVLTHPEDAVNDALLMSSRDMLNFERWREGFVRPTLDDENWTDRNNYVAWGIVPLNEREIGIYTTDHYRHPTARLVLNTLRTDGFVSLYADATAGQAITRPFTFTGDRLVLNYATSAAGVVRCELSDAEGKPYPGFALGDSEVLYGNELAHTFAWKAGADVSSLAGKPVRLRVLLKDADLYSFRFVAGP